MKANIDELRESFKIGYEAFEESRAEANLVWDLYHNRQFNDDELAILASRGQPAETFNVIKMFARMLLGYYSTVVNTVVVTPANPRDLDNVALLNDVIAQVFEDNRFDIEGDQIKLGGLISGLLCSYTNVAATGKTDEFGRPINRIVVHHVHDSEIVLDPASALDDYSDASFMHRFRWMSKDKVIRAFGAAVVDKLDAYYNHLAINEAEFEFNYGVSFSGSYRVFDNYLIVHSVVEELDGKRWSCFWSGEEMLLKQEITHKEAKWPYRIQKLHSSNKKEYYGLFREVIESQRAINQAVIKIQLMVNSEKAYVEDGAVKDIDAFTTAFNRVNSVIEVTSLQGIKVENLSRDIQELYIIVDRALDRIQRVLGINDSFLGMAYASDSGRKVKLQQSATIMSLRYVTARIESFYRSLGWDIAHLVKQYYTASQVLAIADEVVGNRWIAINKPMMERMPGVDADGNPNVRPILLPATDPATGEPMVDGEGNYILAPVSEDGTDFEFTDFQVRVTASAYNDEDEKSQLMLESVMSGQIGQMLSKVNPAAFFKVSSLALRTMKTKYSPEIAALLDETGQALAGNPAAQAQAQEMAMGGASNAGPMSRTMKLPQNTNEA